MLCRLRKSMLISLKASSLVLKLLVRKLYYEEPTKCSKWILNTINIVNRPNYLSDCNATRTHDHLARKRTLNHLAKLDLFSLFCW